MNVDPIAQQTLLSALRSTQGLKTAPPASEPTPSTPTDALAEGTANSEEVAYKKAAGLSSAVPAAPAAEQAPSPPEADAGVPVSVLAGVSREAMESRGLATEFSAAALEQVTRMGGPPPILEPGVQDLRHLAWASIDNADTRDIDQLAYAEDLGNGKTRLRVAIADVACAFAKDSPLDQQAQQNTVTVYTPGKIFPMLPEQLSTDWTSLGPDVDRRALVTDLVVAADGTVERAQVYPAAVNNKAKLDYVSVSAWLEGSEAPEAIARVPGMDRQIRLQMEVGQRLGEAFKRRGALEFEADRVMPVVENGYLVDLVMEEKNQASEAVANMMIATNTANAAFLREKGFPVFQRVVEAPERWDRMREVAAQEAARLPDGQEMPSELAILPPRPDPAALSRYLREYKQRDPQHYPEVSQSMLKLMGGGDYAVTEPGQPLKGHFGQGVPGGDQGYLHSTAPNRRFPDVIIQRLLKAACNGEPCPYSPAELQSLAERCNQQESAARGAERQVRKAATAHYLSSQVGEQYEATVSGRNPKKGVFVSVTDPPIEGKLIEGVDGLDVGDKVRVCLRRVDMERGHIDFVPVA